MSYCVLSSENEQVLHANNFMHKKQLSLNIESYPPEGGKAERARRLTRAGISKNNTAR